MSFYEAIRPLHVMSKLSGVTMFTINAKTLKPQIKVYDVLIIIGVIAVSFFLNKQFWNLLSGNKNFLESRLLKIIFPFLIYGKFFINILAMIWSFMTRAKISKIVEKITEIDDLVRAVDVFCQQWFIFLFPQFTSLQIDFKYRSMRRTMTAFVGCVTVLEILLITISHFTEIIYGDTTKGLVWLIILCSVQTLTMFLCQVIFFILTIKRRFTAINDFIKETPVVRLSDLKLVSRIHLKLTETIEVMNKSYCVCMMLFLTGAFCLLNVFLYCLKVLIAISNFEFFVVFSGKILLNFYTFTMTMFVIFIANRTSQQARRTIRMLFEILHSADYDDEFITQLLNFVDQISNSQTVFSCGLLNFDFKLFFKVINDNRNSDI